MRKPKSIARINIWERDRNSEYSSFPDYHRDIYIRSLKTKGNFLFFKTTEGKIVAYNVDSIFKYTLEPTE